jgi:hypothetical protein
MTRLPLITPLLVCVVFAATVEAQLVRSGFGPDPASLQAVVDQYRADLGALNPNVAGSFGTGRREINWDAVPDAFSAPNDLPGNFFNSTSLRGAVFSTPGSAVQVSADDNNPSNAAVRFGNINPQYANIFRDFSPQRLFSPIGSNIVDTTFFVPGSNTPATTRGFGAIYTDTDDDSGSSFEFFDAAGQSLGTFFPPTADNALSFLGVSYPDPIVARVRIQYGNSALGPDDGGPVDVAVMDDFIYGEPVAVPEPSMGLLALLGLGTILARNCRRS